MSVSFLVIWLSRDHIVAGAKRCHSDGFEHERTNQVFGTGADSLFICKCCAHAQTVFKQKKIGWLQMVFGQ